MRNPNALLVEMKIGAAPVELVCPPSQNQKLAYHTTKLHHSWACIPRTPFPTTETRTSAFMAVPLTKVTIRKQHR